MPRRRAAAVPDGDPPRKRPGSEQRRGAVLRQPVARHGRCIPGRWAHGGDHVPPRGRPATPDQAPQPRCRASSTRHRARLPRGRGPGAACTLPRGGKRASCWRSSAGVGAPCQGRQRLPRSEEHTSELQSRSDLVCRLLLEKKKKSNTRHSTCKSIKQNEYISWDRVATSQPSQTALFSSIHSDRSDGTGSITELNGVRSFMSCALDCVTIPRVT